MKYISTLLLAIALLFSCQERKIDINPKLIGEYYHSFFNDREELELKANGQFTQISGVYFCEGGGRERIITGNYTTINNQILFFPKKEMVNERAMFTFSPGSYRTKYVTDSSKIAMNRIYDIIEFNQELILLSRGKVDRLEGDTLTQNDYDILVNDLNQDTSNYKKPFLIFKWKKECLECDTIKDVRKVIPPDYQDCLFEKTLKAKVIKIDSIADLDFSSGDVFNYFASINKGYKDGLKEGMVFYFPKNSVNNVFREMEIIEVSPNTSRGRVYLFGDFELILGDYVTSSDR